MAFGQLPPHQLQELCHAHKVAAVAGAATPGYLQDLCFLSGGGGGYGY